MSVKLETAVAKSSDKETRNSSKLLKTLVLMKLRRRVLTTCVFALVKHLFFQERVMMVSDLTTKIMASFLQELLMNEKEVTQENKDEVIATDVVIMISTTGKEMINTVGSLRIIKDVGTITKMSKKVGLKQITRCFTGV